jgi:hypothetical protein
VVLVPEYRHVQGPPTGKIDWLELERATATGSQSELHLFWNQLNGTAVFQEKRVGFLLRALSLCVQQ